MVRPRRLWEVEGGPLNQGEVKGNRKVQVAGVKGRPGEGQALVAERHSGMSGNEGGQRRWPVLVTRWRPEVTGTQSQEPEAEGDMVGAASSTGAPQGPLAPAGAALQTSPEGS